MVVDTGKKERIFSIIMLVRRRIYALSTTSRVVMKHAALCLLCVLIAPLAYSQPFSFSDTDVPVQKALVYQKSNLDGTNAGKIALYHVSTSVIEAFKWREGATQATKVRAEIDLETLNVRRFEAFSVSVENGDIKRAELLARSGGVFDVQMGENKEEVVLADAYWHSYDFDFSSLGYAFRFLIDRDSGLQFQIYDLDMAMSPPVFKDFGAVSMVYQKRSSYAGQKALEYTVDGAGLDQRGGTIWFDERTADLLGFEIEKPDEPGYASGKLVLQESLQLSPDQWTLFQKRMLGGD